MSSNQRDPEAFRSSGLFEDGIGYVVVSRFKSGGRVETGAFLVDVFCLGVKDAVFRQIPSLLEYDEWLEEIFAEGREPMEPAAARKLVEQAVAYAAHFGLAPAADYKKGCRVFGGIRAEDWLEDFTFGKDGKPFFISGPNETPARCEQILGALERSCGPGNYGYMVGDDMEEGDWELENEEEEFEPDDIHLEPKKHAFTNPPGLLKLSDLLAEVAAPLMGEDMSVEVASGNLDMAAAAWNYPLLSWPQKLSLKRTVKSKLGPQALEIFKMLIDRRLELYPDDPRLVTKVEVRETGADKFDVHVEYLIHEKDLPAGLEVPKG